ncbi:MmcQ/YjbR family DNA-binding protein [Streptomyces subrutilus]|uniref:DNA-binding protein n=1 Tax=Streptomyces subrutilus TaxID=36818 RepID=A0A5P2UMW2_9ACTN|nr:MmcQ/YjbR family DNA-binding protein [Streptomyces subrutilus]QEU80676.1 MmcQ/YjbR family DNA-binding protein [Streptomyces subrutilus]WSJ30045.1 MmcQ/YjbR family DNA-binding protein [Streptomyces subrutilus]GGZ74441.1 DNA-binding protein [Streptomyces subrutilus]
MTPEALRELCLSFNAAVEEFPFTPETSVFKVLGKMFALTALDAEPLKVNLKCEPEQAVRLREEHEAVAPGYHMNKRHWNTVTAGGPGGLPDALLRELVEDSYDLVVAGLPRAERLRLDRP